MAKNFIKTLLHGAEQRDSYNIFEAEGVKGDPGIEGDNSGALHPWAREQVRRVEATDKHTDDLLTLRQKLYERDAEIVANINRLTAELVHVRHTINATEAGLAALDSPMATIKEMPTLANLRSPKIVSEETKAE